MLRVQTADISLKQVRGYMGFYELTPYTAEAEQYDGANIHVIKEILSHQKPPDRMAVTGRNLPYIRQPNRPDAPLIRGDWIVIDQEHWAHHLSDDIFRRLFNR